MPAALDSATISYNAADRSYTVSGHGQTSTFTPATQSQADSDITNYTKKTPSGQEDLILANPGPGNTDLALTYMTYGVWARSTGSTSIGLSTDFIIYGVPTAASDLPRTGTATYQTVVSGLWTTATDLRTVDGDSTLSANFAAGTTQMTLKLTGESGFTGADYTLGAFSGSGTINSANASFSGNLAATSGSGYNGAYVGRFYGPGAVEAGAAFNLANGSSSVVGVVVGHK